MKRRGFFRWWRDEPSRNEVRETLGYFIEVYLPWLPLLSGLVLPTPSGLRPGLVLSGWFPVSWAIGCVGFKLRAWSVGACSVGRPCAVWAELELELELEVALLQVRLPLILILLGTFSSSAQIVSPGSIA